MIILDTNILSALMKTSPDMEVVSWLDSVPAESIWITSITVFEAQYGISLIPESKKRSELALNFQAIIKEELENRILFFDAEAAKFAATLSAMRRKNGTPIDTRDTFIAGIAISKKATLVTRNIRHFNDLDVRVINPWDC